MDESLKYYTTKTLAAAAGVSVEEFYRHLKKDVGWVRTWAREKVPGLGVRYDARKCEEYLRSFHENPWDRYMERKERRAKQLLQRSKRST